MRVPVFAGAHILSSATCGISVCVHEREKQVTSASLLPHSHSSASCVKLAIYVVFGCAWWKTSPHSILYIFPILSLCQESPIEIVVKYIGLNVPKQPDCGT